MAAIDKFCAASSWSYAAELQATRVRVTAGNLSFPTLKILLIR